MSKGVITLPDALKIYDSGIPFSLTWCTADRKRGTGGQLRHEETIQKCVISEMSDPILKRNGINPAGKRDPSHFEHSTRNFYIPHNREIKKIHIMLMMEINGKTILL